MKTFLHWLGIYSKADMRVAYNEGYADHIRDMGGDPDDEDYDPRWWFNRHVGA